MRRRGFTLLEVLVALGVLGVVLGLSLPALNARLERGSFEGSAERLAGAVRLAKEEARDSGRPVTVRARTLESGAMVIEWSAGMLQSEPRPSDGGPAEVGDEQRWTSLTELAIGLAIGDRDPGQTLDLDEGLQATGSSAAWPGESADAEDLLFFDDELAGERVRTLGVFLPSAEAIVQGPVYLIEQPRDEAASPERWASLTVSPWTGRISLEVFRARSRPAALTSEGDDDADLLEPPPDDHGRAP